MDLKSIDLSELRAMWAQGRERLEDVLRRTDPRGMTRPARDPDERAFLESIGGEGPFVEVDMPGWREWLARRGRPPGAAEPDK
ncbi:MAG TPA: hypothetical protein VNP72_06800 [Longimicrobium sp.]|nr:hypothetical protein [Longimicrobium sp.]